ncbi:peptidyl-prolyl cis-trans isomerase FKBP2 isoform 2-T7 [Vipera latastei]
MGLLALGVSRSLSGGLPGHAGAKRDSGWLPKEWPRDPAQASGEVWVPRKPARPPERTGLPWLKEGAVPRKSGGSGAQPGVDPPGEARARRRRGVGGRLGAQSEEPLGHRHHVGLGQALIILPSWVMKGLQENYQIRRTPLC